jgi:hypothetical protein
MRLSTHFDTKSETGGIVLYPNAAPMVERSPVDFENPPSTFNDWTGVNMTVYRNPTKNPGGLTLNTFATYRAVAACVRLVYTGSEASKSG